MRQTITILAAAALLAVTGCSSNDQPAAENKPKAAVTVTATATATATVPKEEIIQQCTDAVAEAAPGWADWNLDLKGWKTDPQTPEVCKSLENLDFYDAFVAGLDAADDPRAS
ncbi:hypothetical protein PV417_31500 [Streptomyces sp. ME19-03-3]|nr:hypothetical protein [Streptomyces sp. ME19-03-3]